MTRKKQPPSVSIVRSSAAEYLTFVAASGTGGVEAVYADENVYADESVWLSQKMMAQLYDVEVPTINYHLKKVFEDSELEEGAVLRNFRITAADGKGYDTKHYNLSAIIAVGYKVKSERAVQFRKWATRVAESMALRKNPHDHAGLGDAAEPLPRRDRPCGAFGRWQGDRRDRQGACRERVREVPHRARPPIRERLRPGRRRVEVAWRGRVEGSSGKGGADQEASPRTEEGVDGAVT